MSDITLLPFCECGCGEPVAKIGNRFIHGHHKGNLKKPDLTNSKKSKPKGNPCKCGCGELALQGNDYIIGHNLRGQEHPRGMLGKKASHETREKMSKASEGIPKSPEHIKAAVEGLKKYYKNPEVRKERSEALKNSDAHKAASEQMRGGNDIVDHHYIYDHANTELYTMKVTRSKHYQIHHWMRKAEIIIPHINEGIGPWRYVQ